MPKRGEYRIGDGPRLIPVWLRSEEPVVLTGLDEYPKVGDRLVIDGELWRLVEISDRWVSDREPS